MIQSRRLPFVAKGAATFERSAGDTNGAIGVIRATVRIAITADTASSGPIAVGRGATCITIAIVTAFTTNPRCSLADTERRLTATDSVVATATVAAFTCVRVFGAARVTVGTDTIWRIGDTDRGVILQAAKLRTSDAASHCARSATNTSALKAKLARTVRVAYTGVAGEVRRVTHWAVSGASKIGCRVAAFTDAVDAR